MKQWMCRTCRYMTTDDEPPRSCPVCRADAGSFEENEDDATEPELRRPLSLLLPSDNTLWRCQVCNFEHRGAHPPNVCPVCGVGPDLWDEVIDSSRPHMDTDPSLLSATATCAVCTSSLGASLPEACLICGARKAWLSTLPSAFGTLPPQSGNPPRTFVIIGSGIAALRAAETIRANDNRAQVIMLTREVCLPYNRLNLARYLEGEANAASTILHPQDWYAEQDIELRLETEVKQIFPREHLIRTQTRDIPYDRLVLATGSRVVIPPIPNIWMDGVRPLRSLADFAWTIENSRVGRRILILGAGPLGLETAVALRHRGCEVLVCEAGDAIMRQELDGAASRLLQHQLERQGIRFLLSRKVTAIEGDISVRGVYFGESEKEPADLILLATGIAPNTTLARTSGLAVNHGVIVDDTLQTSDPDIYAAGDVVEHRGHVFGTWAAAMEMGSVAGGNAAAGAEMFVPPVQAATLRVGEVELGSIGKVSANKATERELVHTTEAGAIYQKIVIDQGRLIGCILLGDTRPFEAVRVAVLAGWNLTNALEKSRSLQELLLSLQHGV